MKLLYRILIMWAAALIVIVASSEVYSTMEPLSIANLFLMATSALLGLVSSSLFMRESRKPTKLVFFNFAILFGSNAVLMPLYRIMKNWCFASNAWLDFYFCQYNVELYFLLLSFSVLYLVVDHVFNNPSAFVSYFASFAIALGIWVSLLYPFLTNAEYLCEVPDVRNFVAIRETITKLRHIGVAKPSAEQIASSTQITLPRQNDEEGATSTQQLKSHITELMQYTNGDDWVLLLYRPLWRRLTWLGLFSFLSILLCVAHQYVRDSPSGVYMEKIVWCLLPYCGFEALHFAVFAMATSLHTYLTLVSIGRYLTMVVMWLMLLLFGLRLRFINSVEGGYYERQIIEKPEGITRWRDAFDSWILKRFMNPRDIDRRFLIKRRTEQ